MRERTLDGTFLPQSLFGEAAQEGKQRLAAEGERGVLDHLDESLEIASHDPAEDLTSQTAREATARGHSFSAGGASLASELERAEMCPEERHTGDDGEGAHVCSWMSRMLLTDSHSCRAQTATRDEQGTHAVLLEGESSGPSYEGSAAQVRSTLYIDHRQDHPARRLRTYLVSRLQDPPCCAEVPAFPYGDIDRSAIEGLGRFRTECRVLSRGGQKGETAQHDVSRVQLVEYHGRDGHASGTPCCESSLCGHGRCHGHRGTPTSRHQSTEAGKRDWQDIRGKSYEWSIGATWVLTRLPFFRLRHRIRQPKQVRGSRQSPQTTNTRPAACHCRGRAEARAARRG